MALGTPAVCSSQKEQFTRGLLSSCAVKLFAADLSSLRSYWKSKSSPRPWQPFLVGVLINDHVDGSACTCKAKALLVTTIDISK